MTKAELLKTAKPIIFDTESVRAILDGRKTAARTVIKLPDGLSGHIVYEFGDKGKPLYLMYAGGIKTPKYQAGDILYVKETWQRDPDGFNETPPENWWYYKATNELPNTCTKWRSPAIMPKEAARIFLRVTGVRVERLQDIDAKGCILEGIDSDIWTKAFSYSGDKFIAEDKIKSEYSSQWRSRIKKKDLDKYGWEANPYVFIYEFERVEVEE